MKGSKTPHGIVIGGARYLAIEINEIAIRVTEIDRPITPFLGAGWFDPRDILSLQSRVLLVDIGHSELQHDAPIVSDLRAPGASRSTPWVPQSESVPASVGNSAYWSLSRGSICRSSP